MKVRIVLSICCKFEMHYDLMYEDVVYTVKGDVGLVTFLKRRFNVPIEEGFGVADLFLELDQVELEFCRSLYC